MATRVYDGDEVDEYIGRLQEHIEQLNAELDALRRAPEPAASMDGVAGERALGRALIQAQLAAERIVEEARVERDALLAGIGYERDRQLEAAAEAAAAVVAAARAESEQILAGSRAEGHALIQSGRQEAEAVVAQTRRQADQFLALARQEADSIPERAREKADATVTAAARQAAATRSVSLNGHPSRVSGIAARPLTDVCREPGPGEQEAVEPEGEPGPAPILAPPPTGRPILPWSAPSPQNSHQGRSN